MKTVYKIGMLAVAALAFAGCSKEVETQKEIAGTHTLTFTVQKDIDTKTAVQEGDGVASYFWTEGDEAYMVIFENDKKATNVVMSDLSEDHKIATFTATFADSEETSFTYKAVYGSSVSNSMNPLIPSEQSPALKSFDPAADALVSVENITLEDGAKADSDTEFKFKLRRVVSVNKMTLKGLTPGEKITRVELESTEAYFTARYMQSGEYRTSGSDGSKKLSFDYSKVNAVVAEDGTFPVYFTCAPVDGAVFSVKVMTDSHMYTRDDFTSTLTFAVGTFRRFGINLSNYGKPLQQATEYKLVENNSKIADGAEYLIVAKDKGKAAGAYSGTYYSAEAVNVSNKAISITSEAVLTFTLEADDAGHFFMKDSEDMYVYYTGSSNNVSRSDTKGTTNAYLWAVTSEGITNVGSNTRKMQYNAGSPRFACYSTSQTAIELYVNEATLVQKLATPEIEIEAGEDNIYVIWDAVEGAASYKVTCTGLEDISTTETEVTISDLEVGFYTVTVTAISGSDTYRDSDPASADVKIGTPELGKAVITSVTPKPNGFDAVFTGVENAEAYRWVVFDAEGTGVGGGETSALSFSSTYNEEDYWEEMVDGATYRLVIYADAEGFATSESDAFRFVWKGPSYDFTTVAELNALASSTATEYTGRLTDAVVSFVPNAKNAIIKDEAGSILLYVNTSDGHGLVQGQTFTGVTKVKVTLYNGASELTSCDAEFVGSGAVVNPETVTLTDLVGNFDVWQNAYVTVEDLEVVSISDKNINVQNGDNTYVVYSSAATPTCGVGDIIKVTGTIAQYQNKDQVKAWTANDITITQQHQVTTHAVTFTQAPDGGTFTVSANGENITSGTRLMEGTVVTLTAYPEEGWLFDSWVVSGATLNGNTFTVGTSDVSVSAIFIEDVGGTDVTFTTADFEGQGTATTGSDMSATKSGITFDCDKGYGTTQIRCYKGSNITISAESGKTIVGIRFTFSGSYTGGLNSNYTGLSTTSWTQELGSQARFTEIVVTYK